MSPYSYCRLFTGKTSLRSCISVLSLLAHVHDFSSLLWLCLLLHHVTETAVLIQRSPSCLCFVQPSWEQNTISYSLLPENTAFLTTRIPLSAFLPTPLPWVSLHWCLYTSSEMLRFFSTWLWAPSATSLPSLLVRSSTTWLLTVFVFLFLLFTPDVNIQLLPDNSILCLTDISDLKHIKWDSWFSHTTKTNKWQQQQPYLISECLSQKCRCHIQSPCSLHLICQIWV